MTAVIYARYSSEKQNDASIEQQVEYCREFAARNDLVISNVYSDRALSGRADNRPGFQQMIADAQRGLFDTVICYKTDRFSRSRYDAAHYKRILKQSGIRLLFAAEESLNSGDASTIILESLMEGMAEWYSANLSENVTRGMEDNARKCRVNGGNRPYGYRNNNGTYEPDENARWVKLCFQMVADGYSYAEIREEMKTHPTNRGWGCSNIYQTIRNPKYKGTYVWNGIETEDGMTPIVSKELWEAANRMIDGRRQGRSAKYPLSGKLHDEHGAMVGTSATSRNGTTYRYYLCKKCRRTISKDKIETMVVKMTKDAIASPESVEILADMMTAYLEEPEPSRYALEQAESELEKVVDAILDNPKSRSLQERLASLEEEVERLREEVKKQRKPRLSREEVALWLEGFLLGESSEHDEKLLKAFVREVHIEENTLSVFFNYREGLTETDSYEYSFKESILDNSRMVDYTDSHPELATGYGWFALRFHGISL